MELTVQDFVAHRSEAQGNSQGPVPRRPLDLVQLARYTLGNRTHEHEVLELFRTQLDLYLERLATAADDRAWQETARTIRGSASCIGAWRIAEIAATAEMLEGDSLAADRARIIAALQREVEATNRFIRTLLGHS